ncbi:hypothetical protein [Lederbergia lenta]|uniref:Bacterial Pleckstrin homology domain-containing protein n=1 Tax=Lederbergia lenta TaxID=1467 RepID=A0A2X4W9K7_LEDLE|nr:hypothetical protein [Lederbergia lenta]MCM3109683.1 hypothetical protein [Lederbergia lenta]MEC2324566.1 hypothetical protein [Lederbergia lenta]SQI59439.1 Uncharacterised protein [Lederbergia lenta]
MSFQVVAGDRELLLNISGWTAALTLRREIKIPYTSIEEIRVGKFHFSWTAAIKRTGITTFGYKAGIFMIEDEKYFLAYHNENEVVMLKLKGCEFDHIVFESRNYEQLVHEIMRDCPSINLNENEEEGDKI